MTISRALHNEITRQTPCVIQPFGNMESPSIMTEPPATLKMSELMLPAYLPMQRSILGDFDKQARFPQNCAEDLRDLMKRVVKVSNAHVDYMLEQHSTDVNEYLTANMEVIKSLDTTLEELEQYVEAVKSGCGKVHTRADADPELSLELLDQFRSEKSPPFGDLISKAYASRKNGKKQPRPPAEMYQYLGKLRFVILNPEDPLPDEFTGAPAADDDEINVSGGKISLKDPISLDYFKSPVVSKKCNHTFEEEFIKAHLRSGKPECPVAGCGADIELRDLSPDYIMRYRVKAYVAAERTRKPHVDRVV